MELFSLDKLEKAVAAAEQDEKAADTAAKEVRDALIFSEAAQRQLEKMPLAKRRTLLAHLNLDLEATATCLAKNRLHQNPTVRIRVWKALIGQIISGQMASKAEAEAIIVQLVSSGFLVEEPNGLLSILGKSYSVAPESLFEEQDLAEVRMLWAGFQERVKTTLKESATLTISELLSGKKGLINLFVPPQQYSRGNEKSWRPGGVLILESDRIFVKPLEVIGGKTVESVIAAAITLDVKVTVRELTWTAPPSIKFDPADNIAKERNSKTQALWHMIQRGIRFAAWMAKTQNKANLTGQEFFLEGKCGRYFLDHGEPWRDSRTTEPVWISRPAFLIERLEKDGKTFIQVIEVPDHLTDWLANCRESYLEGEKFAGLPQPLQAVLKRIYGQTAKDEEKTLASVDRLVASLDS